MRLGGAALLLLAALSAAPGAASAQSAEEAAARLEQVQRDARAVRERQAKFARERESLQQEMEDLQALMVKLTREVQQREVALLRLEERAAALGGQEALAQAELKKRQAETGALVSALIGLAEAPPLAVLAMPGELEDTLTTAGVLERTAEALREKAAGLRRRLEELAALQAELAETRKHAEREQEALDKRQRELAESIDARQGMQATLNAAYLNDSRRIAELSRQSTDIKALIAELEARRPAHAQLTALPKPKPGRAAAPRKPAQVAKSAATDLGTPRKGALRMPVTGVAKNTFGAGDAADGRNRGLLISGRSGAPVVAPASGEVVFTGPFQNYGNMVILRYGADDHVLMAGLASITSVPGQRVVAGEPVGRLGGGSELYVELRHKQQPVNPRGWFDQAGNE